MPSLRRAFPTMNRFLYTAILLQAFCAASAQNLSVSVSDVDFSGLPRIKVTVCAEQEGVLLRGLEADAFRLRENGIRYPVTARCPDPLAFNSVALVLDNSGSMSPVMTKLIEAAGRLVDSLDPLDECAVVTFGRNVQMLENFTIDRNLLKSALAGLYAEGGTPLFDASMLALDSLALRAGNRVAVIITDGEDNLSEATDSAVIARARQLDARLYTIAFGISDENQLVMRNMAIATGGDFFSVVRPSELPAVYEKIAADITEKCCRIEYYSENCVDTLRSIDVAVLVGGDSARAQASFVSPSRPDTMRLSVEAPDALFPLESGMGWISCEPPPSPLLELTLSFTLVFDEDLVDVTPRLPFTLGTAAQNQVVDMVKVGTGRLRFIFSRIIPVPGSGRLIGFPLQGLPADSSRRVRIGIEDIVLDGGPVRFIVSEDSVSICQCLKPLALEFDSLTVISRYDEVVLPLRATGGISEGAPLMLDALISLPEGVEVAEMIEGVVLPRDALRGEPAGTSSYRISAQSPVMPLRSVGTLLYLRLNIKPGGNVTALTVRCDSARLWQLCCPADTARRPASVLLDGYCEPLLSRRDGRLSLAASPDPLTRGEGQLTARALVPRFLDGRIFTADAVDMLGRPALRIFERSLPAGENIFEVNTGELPSGLYILLLGSGDSIAAKPFRIVDRPSR